MPARHGRHVVRTAISTVLIVLAAGCVTPPAARAAFSCGPNLGTYAVQSTSGQSAAGVRCVEFVDRNSFAWYGEGMWSTNALYRHLGYAIRDGGSFRGSAADFEGNGESTSGRQNGTIRLNISDQPVWDENR